SCEQHDRDGIFDLHRQVRILEEVHTNLLALGRQLAVEEMKVHPLEEELTLPLAGHVRSPPLGSHDRQTLTRGHVTERASGETCLRVVTGIAGLRLRRSCQLCRKRINISLCLVKTSRCLEL